MLDITVLKVQLIKYHARLDIIAREEDLNLSLVYQNVRKVTFAD